MELELRLYQDLVEAKAAVPRSPERASLRVLYVVEGALRLRGNGAAACIGANSAWHSAADGEATGGSVPTTLLRWELVRRGAGLGVLAGPGFSSRLCLAAPIVLPDSQGYLLRCDRVDFPPEGEALTHTHRGPGIRCLLFGGIRIETAGATHRYGPLEAWFEAGPDPVYAGAASDRATAFARVMILPRELAGKSSIRYVRTEDLDKPKSQSYQVFIDEPIELPFFDKPVELPAP